MGGEYGPHGLDRKASRAIWDFLIRRCAMKKNHDIVEIAGEL